MKLDANIDIIVRLTRDHPKETPVHLTLGRLIDKLTTLRNVLALRRKCYPGRDFSFEEKGRLCQGLPCRKLS